MAGEADILAATRALSVLGSRTRLRILAALAEGEAHVGALQTRLGAPQAIVSYHLAVLRAAGLVRTRRDAQRVYYALDRDGWESARAAIARVLGPSA